MVGKIRKSKPMQTISSIARELDAQGLLNKEALWNLRKWQRILYIKWLVLGSFLLGFALSGNVHFAIPVFVTLMIAIVFWEMAARLTKQVRLYTYGTKVPGKYVRTTGGYRSYCLNYQFETREGNIISTRESFLSNKGVLMTEIPFKPNQDIEVLYNPKKIRENTVFIPEYNNIFNLKRES